MKVLMNNKAYVIIIALIMIAVISLRCLMTGKDTSMYGFIYNDLDSFGSYKSWYGYNILMGSGMEFGYATVIWLCHYIMDYRGFLFIDAMLCIAPFTYVVYKRSEIPWLSFILYILFNYLTWNMCASRQAPAVAMGLLSIFLFYEGKWKSSLIWLILAFSFHSTVLVIIPAVIAVKYIKNDKLILVLAIITKIIGSGLISLIIPYMRIDYTDDVLTESVGQLTYFGFFMLLLVMMWLKNKSKLKVDYAYYMFAMVIILWPLIDTLAAAFRVTFYFMVFICFVIPNMLVQYRKTTWSKIILLASAIVVGSIYFSNRTIKSNMDVNPYYSVFEYPDRNNYPNLYND